MSIFGSVSVSRIPCFSKKADAYKKALSFKLWSKSPISNLEKENGIYNLHTITLYEMAKSSTTVRII